MLCGLTVGLLFGRGASGPPLNWLGSVLVWSTVGYGEQPLRVLGFSGVVVGVAALCWATEAQFGAGLSAGAGSWDT